MKAFLTLARLAYFFSLNWLFASSSYYLISFILSIAGFYSERLEKAPVPTAEGATPPTLLLSPPLNLAAAAAVDLFTAIYWLLLSWRPAPFALLPTLGDSLTAAKEFTGRLEALELLVENYWPVWWWPELRLAWLLRFTVCCAPKGIVGMLLPLLLWCIWWGVVIETLWWWPLSAPLAAPLAAPDERCVWVTKWLIFECPSLKAPYDWKTLH